MHALLLGFQMCKHIRTICTGVENLWEFIRNLLMDRRYCPEVIRWVDYETKKFRFVDTHKVAKLWGARFNGEGNNAMTYAKFTRCIR